MRPNRLPRRAFLSQCATIAPAALAAGVMPPNGPSPGPRVKVAVIGCGSVSRKYFPHLLNSPHVELVSACDRIPERARQASEQFGVPNHYPSIDALLAGAPFDMLVNLTDMQEHAGLNRRALEAGKHVWSEKPLANTYEEGAALLDLARQKGVRLWSAPAVVTSPQFAFMARQLRQGAIGRVAAAHAAYGHLGPNWSAFFYEQGGGSLPDLAVYNLATLTGLLGPAKSVTAMTSIVTPEREIRGRGTIRVEAEDNAMVLMDHGHGVLSHVASGFNYFDPHGHSGDRQRPTLWVTGTAGTIALIGYDWAPHGVEVSTTSQPEPRLNVEDPGSYRWEEGASRAAECLATGNEIPITPEHALHVVEIIEAARLSQRDGRRVTLRSTFPWPVPV